MYSCFFHQFSCCGIDGFADYTSRDIFETPIYPDQERNNVPASCCWGLVTCHQTFADLVTKATDLLAVLKKVNGTPFSSSPAESSEYRSCFLKTGMVVEWLISVYERP